MLMADYRDGLRLVPQHMHASIKAWLERGEPHPFSMGQFFFSVLCNRLVQAALAADVTNRAALANWAEFLHNYLPDQAWGDETRLMSWHDMKHTEKS
jgi:hypothetical protein